MPLPPRFSANLGFLWTHLPLPERIRAAASAGFDAVEFHDDAQAADLSQLRDLLQETGLPVCALNVRMGATAGCAALAGYEDQARRDVDAALHIAQRLGAGAVHVLAGRSGRDGCAETYMRVLRHALDAGDRMILIEPICRQAMADYFLSDLTMAADILGQIAHPRLKIMFDVFHIGMQDGPGRDMPPQQHLAAQFDRHAPQVGHVQLASLPGRNEPGVRDWLDPVALTAHIRGAGYAGAFGCEYRPLGRVEDGLHWRDPFHTCAPPCQD